MPTDRRVLFGHHFAAIAGAGPLVGPVLAAQMGYLPGRHLDHHRRRASPAASRTTWCCGSPPAAAAAAWVRWPATSSAPSAASRPWSAVFVIMVILIAVLALVVVNALAESPWGVFSIAMTIPIALFMGVYLRFFRPGKVSEVSLIGVVLLLLAMVSGGWVAETAGAQTGSPFQGHAGVVHNHLRVRGVGAAGVAAAGAPRLPVHLHEDRHDCRCWRWAFCWPAR